MSEMVVLVDENDREIGTEEKMEAHEEGRLHRAFSIFIFNSKGEMLLQRRAFGKYHSGGLWTNACCSHPKPNESVERAAHRRLREELGFDCKLTERFCFIYKARLDHGLIEHEFDHVLTGNHDGEIVPNGDEVSEILWITIDDLKSEMRRHPNDFTEWFKTGISKFFEDGNTH